MSPPLEAIGWPLAGDEVYADDSSILGSIGVISAGFGFHKVIEKIGVERRVYTAGERKMSLDPFAPEQPEEIVRLKALQKDIHQAFRSLVEDRRGDKITKAGDMLFTGEFWSGTKAVELGLIDGLGDLRSVMREKLGDKVNLKLITPKRGLFRRAGFTTALPTGQNMTAGLTDDLINTLEARALMVTFRPLVSFIVAMIEHHIFEVDKTMPPLLVLAAVGVGAYVGVKWIRNKAASDQPRSGTRQKEHDQEQDEANSARQNFKKPDIDELDKRPERRVFTALKRTNVSISSYAH